MDILETSARAAVSHDVLGLVDIPSDTQLDGIQARMRRNAQQSLYYFSTAVLKWDKIEAKPHLDMCNFIQDVSPPRRRRKLLLIPRDCYKSTVGSKSLPLWILIQDEFCGLPGREHRILLKSFSSENAKKQIRSIRQQIERNQTLQWLFRDLIPDISRTTWTDSNLLFPRDGMYGEDSIEAAGIDTHLVSRHYTVQIKDDIEDKESMESPTVRQRVKTDYKASEALFVDEKTAYDFLIGTRWGIDDVYGDIYRDESEHYDIMCRPLLWTRADLERDYKEAKRNDRKPVWDMAPDTFAPDPDRKYFFFETLFPEDSCKRLRAKNGAFMFSMLYLNNPTDPDLVEFKEQDLGSFIFDPDGNIFLENKDGSHSTVDFDSLKRVLMWDPAMGTKDMRSGSRNSMVCAGRDSQNRIFILEAYAERNVPAFLYDKFIGIHQRYRPHVAAIEAVNFSRTIKYPLMQRCMDLNYTFAVRDQTPVGEKDVRIRALLPYSESHLLFIRRGLKPLLEELLGFPVFGTKDLIDALAACLELFGAPVNVEDAAPSRGHNVVDIEEARRATACARTGY